jgi:spore germination protein
MLSKKLSVGIVNCEKTYAYSLPTVKSKVLASLLREEQAPILSESQYYYKIRLGGSRVGWVRKKHIIREHRERLIVGWHAFGTTTDYMERTERAAPVDIVSPRWMMLQQEAPYVTQTVDAKFVAWCREHGKKVWAMLGNRFDPELTDMILSDASKREELVKALVELCSVYQLDGINVNFENINPRNKTHLTETVSALRESLHPLGKTTTVGVTRLNPDPHSGSYDRRELAKAADYLILMGFEEHWPGGSKAGPAASYPWVEEGIKLLLKEAPAHKILLGIPLFTRKWTSDSEKGTFTSEQLSITQARNEAERRNLSLRWLPITKQHYAEYTVGSQRHQLWVEDKASLEQRLQLVEQYQLGGAAFWYLGMESHDIWSLL